MDNQDELVQVSVSLPKSHFSVLPELMRVVTTACSSSYSWDSMKLSVDSQVPSDKGSRIILNLGKIINPETEVIQGKMHVCPESICKHQMSRDNSVGDVKLTTYFQRSLKDYLKEQEKSDEEELEGTGWLRKEISNEMFFPSWYDNLRLKSVSQLGDGLFIPDRQSDHPASTVGTNPIRIEPFYESASEEYFPIKNHLKPYLKSLENNDETFRLKKICDRAKNFAQPQEELEGSRGGKFTPPNVKTTIRELKERLDLPVSSQPDIYEENYVFIKSTPQIESNEKDYTYRQYLCYDEDLPPYPLCKTDENLNARNIVIENNELQLNFMRQKPTEDFNASPKARDDNSDNDEMIVVLPPPSIKKTLFHRSYSANVVPHQYLDDETVHRDYNHPKKRREEKRRPKSGPEKRVEFLRAPDRDELSQGDSLKLIDVHQQPSMRNLFLNVTTKAEAALPEVIKEKKKKRRVHGSPDRKTDTVKTDSHVYKEHERKIKEKKHKVEDASKDAGPTLVISYKPYEDDTRSDLVKAKPRHREDKANRHETKHRKGKKPEWDDLEGKLKPVPVAENQEDKRERRSKGKGDESKTNKRPKSEKSDKTQTMDSKPPTKPSKPIAQPDPAKEKNPDTPKGKRRGFLGKRASPGNTVREETLESTYDKISPYLEGKIQNNKRAMSFLEIISAMTEEVKQFGKKKEQKRLREQIS